MISVWSLIDSLSFSLAMITIKSAFQTFKTLTRTCRSCSWSNPAQTCPFLKDNHFVFNGQLYDQLDGVAMASPLGPSMANIFMCALEQKYLNGCPLEFKPVLYRRYVDDTYCLIRHREHVDKFLEHINKFHPNIRFTVEVEEDNNLSFLDVLVTHEQGGFSTSLYRKKTFTVLYTDYASLAPDRYKINLVRILVFSAFHICSS